MSKKQATKMRRGLKNRHLQMIALGGAIGTGLFYGSASTIALAGPSVMLAYLLGGIVIFFIMRMLGEMAVDEPVSGSFSYYANKYWGKFPGFMSGWNYWFNYVIVSMAELTAVGIYMNFWLPDLPQWVSALVCLIVITVANFISKFSFEGKPRSVYAVCTCGDDCGLTDKEMAKLLDKKGLKLDACFSVQMPNDYVLFPFFDIDPEKLQHAKMVAAVEKVKALAVAIKDGETQVPGAYKPGAMPWVKTKLIYPLFAHVQCGHTRFYANEKCVSCGLCAKVCAVNNIRLNDGKPQWRNRCIQCGACFHHCPKNAVQYGSLTKGKGQYLNSHVDFDD